jgi:hypothetical protein
MHTGTILWVNLGFMLDIRTQSNEFYPVSVPTVAENRSNTANMLAAYQADLESC